MEEAIKAKSGAVILANLIGHIPCCAGPQILAQFMVNSAIVTGISDFMHGPGGGAYALLTPLVTTEVVARFFETAMGEKVLKKTHDAIGFFKATLGVQASEPSHSENTCHDPSCHESSCQAKQSKKSWWQLRMPDNKTSLAYAYAISLGALALCKAEITHTHDHEDSHPNHLHHRHDNCDPDEGRRYYHPYQEYHRHSSKVEDRCLAKPTSEPLFG